MQESGHGKQATGCRGRYRPHRPPLPENPGVLSHHAAGNPLQLGRTHGRQIPFPQLHLRVKGRVTAPYFFSQRSEFSRSGRLVQPVEQHRRIGQVVAGAMSAEIADIKGLESLRCRDGSVFRRGIQAIDSTGLVPIRRYFLTGGLGRQRERQAQGRKDGQQGGSHGFGGLVESRICRAMALRARQKCRKSSHR